MVNILGLPESFSRRVDTEWQRSRWGNHRLPSTSLVGTMPTSFFLGGSDSRW